MELIDYDSYSSLHGHGVHSRTSFLSKLFVLAASFRNTPTNQQHLFDLLQSKLQPTKQLPIPQAICWKDFDCLALNFISLDALTYDYPNRLLNFERLPNRTASP